MTTGNQRLVPAGPESRGVYILLRNLSMEAPSLNAGLPYRLQNKREFVRRQALFLVNDIHFSRRIVNISRSRGCGQSGNPASFAGFPSEVGKSEGLFHGAAFPQPCPPRVFVRDVGLRRSVS
jgi:hypothetical protein